MAQALDKAMGSKDVIIMDAVCGTGLVGQGSALNQLIRRTLLRASCHALAELATREPRKFSRKDLKVPGQDTRWRSITSRMNGHPFLDPVAIASDNLAVSNFFARSPIHCNFPVFCEYNGAFPRQLLRANRTPKPDLIKTVYGIDKKVFAERSGNSAGT